VNYAGWYPRRRGILEHLEKGAVSLLDVAIHDFLCLIADHRTGVAWASAEKLHALAGAGITLRAVQRSLEKLEGLSWIKRFRVPGRRGNYPTLIGRYFVRDSSLNWLSVNLSRTSDWRDVQFDPVTDPSFSSHQDAYRDDTRGGTEVTPHQESRSKNEEQRGVEFDRESDSECDNGAKNAFDEFDLPPDRKLQLSENLLSSLFIDEDRLSEKDLAAVAKLQAPWKQSWREISAGEVDLAEWLCQALELLRKSKIFYPAILHRRLKEMKDGRLGVA
jgi:hypothetical protein